MTKHSGESYFNLEIDVLVNSYKTGFDHRKAIKSESLAKRAKPNEHYGEFDETRKEHGALKQVAVIWRPSKNE